MLRDRSRKTNGADAPAPTTAQRLGSLLKSARDIMRKDKGLNGDLDRLPMLTWVMFLKFLDDLERQRQEEATLAGERFRPAVERPYRWRDWAGNPQGPTGDDLLAFINHETARLPDGKEGPGLFTYLRGLTASNGDDRRDVIATVFRGVDNRMKSGYLLRDVLDKVSEIHFTSSEELHTLGAMYESMLREMRDAAGDSGEFYTPRPVVRFMVQATDPRLGETLLDPAAGTGGFLVEAFNHLSAQVKTVQQRERLQRHSLTGCEAKGLPYLLCQMNLLLHGLDAPQIDPGNALRYRLTEIGEKDRVDIILTNPPFGGEEERGIQDNFPEDKRTAETALLFLQLIMRKLHRNPTQAGRSARAAVVVPIGTLFGDGVSARIKEDLLREFNLHSVIRLPAGVFAPYTSQETAILFFERSGSPTEVIWYYQHPLPPDRQSLKNPCYVKSAPLRFEEFAPLLQWWHSREQTDCAWKVRAEDIARNGFNLDIRHPATGGAVVIQTRQELKEKITSAAESLSQSSAAMIGLISASELRLAAKKDATLRRLDNLDVSINPENRNPEKDPGEDFQYVDLSSVSHGTIEGIKVFVGGQAPSRARRVIREGDVILSTVRPYLGGHAVIPEALDNEICSTGFAVLRCGAGINPKFLYYMLISPQVVEQFHTMMRGAHYPALKDEHVKALMIPSLRRNEQDVLVEQLDELVEKMRGAQTRIEAFAQRLMSETRLSVSALLADLYGAPAQEDDEGGPIRAAG